MEGSRCLSGFVTCVNYISLGFGVRFHAELVTQLIFRETCRQRAEIGVR
jgi:hypothetical protein